MRVNVELLQGLGKYKGGKEKGVGIKRAPPLTLHSSFALCLYQLGRQRTKMLSVGIVIL